MNEVTITMSSLAEAAGLWFLLIWLAVETGWDLWKSMILPIWLVLPPLIAGGIVQLLAGNWIVTVALTVAVLMHLAPKFWIRAVGTAILVGGAYFCGMLLPAAGFFLYWLLWETNILGGADALGAYAVLLILPAVAFWLLLGGMLVWAVASMFLFYRGRLAARVRQFAMRVAVRDLPTEQELETEGKPTVGGVWLAVVFYAIGRAGGAF